MERRGVARLAFYGVVGVASLACLASAGCRTAEPPPPMHPVGAAGTWYVVQPNESLGDIARRTGIPIEDLLEVNGLRTAAEAAPGKLIFLLEGRDAAAVAAPQPTGPPVVAQGGGARFRWPVEEPRVTSLFGRRWGRPHEGIDLTAPIGTPVHAADAGEVVYAGSAVRGYGNMIVLKHSGDLMTVYAHNSVLMVKVGQRVVGGQRVALSGQSGHATGPHVHFEVRSGQIPRDPLPYLPEIPGWHPTRERTPKS